MAPFAFIEPLISKLDLLSAVNRKVRLVLFDLQNSQGKIDMSFVLVVLVLAWYFSSSCKFKATAI